MTYKASNFLEKSCHYFDTTDPKFPESSSNICEFWDPRGIVKKNYRARIVFNVLGQLLSDIH